MFEYFKDGINPRGPEYGATARAARAAERDADASEDLLELELATSPRARAEAVDRIRARRVRQANRRAWWHRLDLLASFIFVGAVAWYMLT